MKIAIITPYFPPEMNGISYAVMNRAIELNRLNHKCLIIVPEYSNNEQNIIIEKLRNKNIDINLYPTMPIKGTQLGLMPSFKKSKRIIESSIGKFNPELIANC